MPEEQVDPLGLCVFFLKKMKVFHGGADERG